MKYKDIQIWRQHDRLVITMPEEFADNEAIDFETEYELVLLPRESFKKGFKVTKDITENVETNTDDLSSFSSENMPP